MKANLLMRTLICFVLVLLAAAAFAQDAPARRVALVIGNSAYESGPLRNAVNDAVDMAAALQDLGFSVILGRDANKKTMYQLIERFGSEIRGAGIALFYYSGHAVQSGGENYLIPMGADISLASDVEIEAVQLQRLIGRMNAGEAGANVILLDACRNNPFPQATRGMEKGLSVVGTKPPESLIVYATEAGETADDGDGRNGVFTTALLRHIRRTDEFAVIVRDVSAEVRRQTNQKQKPVRYDTLTRAIHLAEPRAQAAVVPEVETPRAPTLTETRSYGSLVVTTTPSGATISVDGVVQGTSPLVLNDRKTGIASVSAQLDGYADASEKKIIEAGKTAHLAWTLVRKKIAIGDSYAGGIVFYLDRKGRGMVAAPSDQSSGASWNDAARLCDELVLNGFSDWKLPSQDDLGFMYTNLHESGRGGFAPAWYWNSAEDWSGTIARLLNFSNGRQGSNSKVYNYHVRAVRAFTQ